jgi:acyl-CoA dehydrogenase
VPGLGQLDDAYLQTVYTAHARKKLQQAVKAGHLKGKRGADLLAEAVEIGLLTNAEAKGLFNAEMARDDAVQVNAFTMAEHAGLK